MKVDHSIGVILMDEWTVQRLDEEDLRKFTAKFFSFAAILVFVKKVSLLPIF